MGNAETIRSLIMFRDYLPEQRHLVFDGPTDYSEETFHIPFSFFFFNFMHFLFTFNDAVYIHHPEILKQPGKKK